MAANISSNKERAPSLPNYRNSLSAEHLKIYDEKLKFTAGIDPYAVSGRLYSTAMENYPEIEYPDIVNYLLFTKSRFTKEQLKAYKSLEAYQYFVAGWVRSIHVGNVTEKTVVLIGKVNHSQRLNEAPLIPWLAVQKNGTVLTAHCNCLAGLGEVCSHVGAILFAVEAGVKMVKSKSCTSELCKWLIPASVTNVPYAQLQNINFTAANTKKQKLDDNISGLSETPSAATNYGSHYVPSQAMVDLFFQKLHNSRENPAILSLVAPYNENYVPTAPQLDLPKSLDGLYEQQLTALSFSELLEKAEDIFDDITCTEQQVIDVEASTRDQRKSELWFNMRAGRITASRFYEACHTSLTEPSISLIKGICYGSKFYSKATEWGNKNEKIALVKYKQVMVESHVNFELRASGLWLSPEYPYLGATPDGITSCDCHGTGLVEVKCPFSVRDQILQEAVDSHKLCLERHSDGALSLMKTHAYWYQVQTQMQITGKGFADFVVWTMQDLHVERISHDTDFFNGQIEKVKELYKTAILPELLAKWYTKPADDIFNTQTLCCYCRVPDSDESLVLVCSGTSCLFKKFHLKCCGRYRKPSKHKAWFCEDCKRLNKQTSAD